MGKRRILKNPPLWETLYFVTGVIHNVVGHILVNGTLSTSGLMNAIKRAVRACDVHEIEWEIWEIREGDLEEVECDSDDEDECEDECEDEGEYDFEEEEDEEE